MVGHLPSLGLPRPEVTALPAASAVRLLFITATSQVMVIFPSSKSVPSGHPRQIGTQRLQLAEGLVDKS